jgi:hypothetical protein
MEAKDDEATLDQYITASAALLGIPIEPAWMPSVRGALLATTRATQFVEAFPLPQEAEPASVFEA